MIPQTFLLKILVVWVIGAFFLCAPLYAQYANPKKEQKESSDAPKEEKEEVEKSRAGSVEVKNKICPVDFKSLYALDNSSQGAYSSEEPPKKKFQYAYEGKTYDFDSAACLEKFSKDPKQYLEEWEKKERFRRINVIND